MMKILAYMGLLLATSVCHAADFELLQQTTVDSAAPTFADETYSVADLNALNDMVFTGTGQIVVGVLEPPVLSFDMVAGDMVFFWSEDGFRLQDRTNLTEGIWLDVPGGGVSPVSVTPSHSAAFYRLIQE